jgi:c-di-GMP-binding flagellar brake protein YcgR
MRQTDTDTFDAIVVPQFIERRTPLVEITMGGIAYLLETSMSFRPGKQHTITITLNTSPDQEKLEISIDGEVGDWN